MALLLDSKAEAELRAAAVFYEECRPGLGARFLDAVGNALAAIQERPRLWRLLKGRFRRRFRRCLVQRFPYAVIYTISGKTIYVAAIAHLKRGPGFWEGRIDAGKQ